MGQRVVRVNELLKREISHILHTRYQSESVGITILSVDTLPSLRAAKVLYATHGDAGERYFAEEFFQRRGESIRREVGKVVRLKYLPHFEFLYDEGADYSARLNSLLDELGLEGEAPPPSEDDY